jgi:hypothetical protein
MIRERAETRIILIKKIKITLDNACTGCYNGYINKKMRGKL